MEAPVYPPAPGQRYQPPRTSPFEFSIDSVSVRELLARPVTRDFVLREFPNIEALMSRNLEVKGHLSNFTLRDMVTVFEQGGAAKLIRIDKELRALVPGERTEA